MSRNADVARVLRELALLSSIDEGSRQGFRSRAYESAAQAVADHTGDIAEYDVRRLTSIKGVGDSTARKIREYLDSGTFPKLDDLRAKYPPAFVELTRIPGLGPKTVVMLRDRLGVENVDDLRAALDAEAIRHLPGMGAKSEDKLRTAVDRLGLTGKDRRTPIARALPIALEVISALERVPGVKQVAYAGSLRRFRETIGDVDIIAATPKPPPVTEAFLTLPIVADVIGSGDTKSSVVTADGLQIDLRVVAPSQFGSALLYFTGSKDHNIQLRQRALDRGWTLSEYALADQETEEVIASRTEKSIYAALDLRYVEPTIREGTGEVEAAATGDLPGLVMEKHLRGDLHVHTDMSGDGRAPLRAMLDGAAGRGLSYIGLTDHGENLSINGVSREQLRAQRKRIDDLRDDYPDMAILQGSELNIAPDGSVDYDSAFLAELDWRLASVHSHFDLDREQQTRRVITAMENPLIHAIGHLMGRKLGRRPGIELDVEAVVEAAARTGTAIEINGAIDRLDATVEVIRAGAAAGAVFVIDTDAHHPEDYRRAAFGVQHAQRAWLERKQVANTWTQAKFLSWVGD